MTKRGHEVVETAILTLRVPVMVKANLRRLAAKNEMSINKYLRKVLELWLSKQES